MRQAKVEIYQGRWVGEIDEQWYWRLRASNGKIIADGSEGYASKASALRAVQCVVKIIQTCCGIIYK